MPYVTLMTHDKTHHGTSLLHNKESIFNLLPDIRESRAFFAPDQKCDNFALV